MKKKILCLILSVVMVMSIMTNLNIITIHAIDEYDPRISFDPNGGSGYMETVYYQGNYPLPECEFTAPEGYQFKCWHRDGDIRELQPGDTVYISDCNTVVSAVWEPIPSKVIFNPGSGSGSMDEVEVFGEYTLPPCDYIAPDGQEFQSWQINNQELQPGQSIYVDNILTVTALWKELPDEEPADTSPIPSTPPTVDNAPNSSEHNGNLKDSNDDADSTWYWIIIIGVMVTLLCIACISIVVLVVVLIKKKNK